MKPVLEDLKILSIDSLGTILLKYPRTKNYEREFAGSLTSEFYMELKKGICGREGQLFAEAVRTFLDQKMGSPGLKVKKDFFRTFILHLKRNTKCMVLAI